MILHRLLKYAAVVQVVFVMITLLLGRLDFSVPFAAILISAPLILSYFLVTSLARYKSELGKVLYGAALGVYAGNMILQLYFLHMYFPSIVQTRSVGPAEGYWLLFTWAGGVQASIAGAVVGGLVTGIFALFKPTS